MARFPDDPDALKQWFRMRLDPLTGAAPPFDRKRFWASTVPALSHRWMRRPSILHRSAKALATAAMLLGVGFFAGRFVGGAAAGRPGLAFLAPSHTQANSAGPLSTSKAVAPATALAQILPPGAVRIELSETVGNAHRQILVTRPHDIAAMTQALGRAPALGPGTYHCPAALSPVVETVFRFIYPSGRVVTVNWVQAGCSWLTVAEGPRPRPVVPGVAGRATFSAPVDLRSTVDLAFEP